VVKFLEVGKITGIHGLQGAMKVSPLTDNPARFKELEFVFIEKNGVMEKHYTEEVKFSGKNAVIRFQDIVACTQ